MSLRVTHWAAPLSEFRWHRVEVEAAERRLNAEQSAKLSVLCWLHPNPFQPKPLDPMWRALLRQR